MFSQRTLTQFQKMKLIPLNLLKSAASVAIAAAALSGSITSADAQDIGSTNFNNIASGNLGTSLSLFDGAVTVTARTRIDPSSPYDYSPQGIEGTIFHEKSSDPLKGGLGVQDAGSGSKGISGGGPRQNEQLVFTYHQGGALAGAIGVQLNAVEFGSKAITNGFANLEKSDPLMWIEYDFGQIFVVNEYSLFNAATPLGKTKTGTILGDTNRTFSESLSYQIDFANIAGLNQNATVTSFTIRETSGHTFVKAFNAGVVPEPSGAALIMAGYGFLMMFRRRR